MCIYPLTSKSLSLRSADWPLHSTFPNPSTENPELSCVRNYWIWCSVLNTKLTLFRFFTNSLSLTLSLWLNIDFHFLPGLWPLLSPFLLYSAGLGVSSAPTHPCPSVITAQLDPNPVLSHHLPAHVQVNNAGENHDTLGVVTIKRWSLTLTWASWLSSIPFSLFNNITSLLCHPEKLCNPE